MKRLLTALAACASIVAACAGGPVYAAEKPDILEVMEINGVITDGVADRITKQVESINDNKRIRAVLLVVDTPGGGVLPSAVIYEELSKIKVPIVGWCQNICASGGMYVLMAPSVKWIGVRTSTISGSVGVIMGVTRFHRLLNWAMIDNETYKSGHLKDSGNPTRGPQPGEIEDLQGTINELAEAFYGIVGKARPNLKPEQWSQIKSARIFFGAGGVKVGLVDAVMTREDAEKKAKALSGSASIFSREEMKKMSKDSGEGSASHYSRDVPAPSMFGDIPWLIDTLKEIKAGTSVTIEYRLPLKL